jgi:hypothetical protein
VRRDEWRTKKRSGDNSADTTLRDAIRRALARRHPLNLLSIASLMIDVAKPESLTSRKCDTTIWIGS